MKLRPDEDLGPLLFTRTRLVALRSPQTQQSVRSGAVKDQGAFQLVLEQVARRREVADQQALAEWESKIECCARRALKELRPDLRQQLAALVHDTVSDLDWYAQHKVELARLKKLAGEADRRRRMLARKVNRAYDALTKLRDYASGLDPRIGESHVRLASWCLEQMGPFRNRPSDSLNHVPTGNYWRELHSGLLANSDTHPVPDDPTQVNMVKLYWFFRHGCKLRAGEAELRTALIRNEFWNQCVPRVRPVLDHATGKPVGCLAVRHAVQRFPSK
jgi:hypothetical protein